MSIDNDDIRSNDPLAKDANRDPISGEPGAHPVGVGLGAAAGGIAAGAAVGSVAGPVGTVIGAAVGAVAGGLGGKALAERFDPSVEDAHWREHYQSQPYYRADLGYDDYEPAYTLGAAGPLRYTGRRFDEVEPDLADEYDKRRGTSRLDWEGARDASRAAWNRVALEYARE
ncbi:MAG: hypothetical protein JWP52_4493 [Rhizobacter sp.]|nr:hypothetical protein [Rhizobacter sp.]